MLANLMQGARHTTRPPSSPRWTLGTETADEADPVGVAEVVTILMTGRGMVLRNA